MRKIILILVLIIMWQFIYYLIQKNSHPDIYYRISNTKLNNIIEDFIRDKDSERYETEYLLLELNLTSGFGRLSYMEDEYLLRLPFIRLGHHLVPCQQIDGKNIIVSITSSSGCFDYLAFDIFSIISYFKRYTPQLGRKLIAEYETMMRSESVVLKSPLYYPKKSLNFSIDNNINYNIEYYE